MIKISPKHLQVIRNHGEKTYPEECCGLLLGKQGDDRYNALTAPGALIVEVRRDVRSAADVPVILGNATS